MVSQQRRLESSPHIGQVSADTFKQRVNSAHKMQWRTQSSAAKVGSVLRVHGCARYACAGKERVCWLCLCQFDSKKAALAGGQKRCEGTCVEWMLVRRVCRQDRRTYCSSVCASSADTICACLSSTSMWLTWHTAGLRVCQNIRCSTITTAAALHVPLGALPAGAPQSRRG